MKNTRNWQYDRDRQKLHRKGIATLEFVMCLPVLLLFFGAILWLGASYCGQSEVTIGARNQAWHERHAGKAEDAFILDRVVGMVNPPPLEDHSKSFSPIFPVDARSEHQVLGGSWDHHQVDLNRQPNWSRFRELSGESIALTADVFGDALNSVVSDALSFDRFRDQIMSMEDDVWKKYDKIFDGDWSTALGVWGDQWEKAYEKWRDSDSGGSSLPF